MTFRPQHEIHTRRFGRNVGVAALLLAFVALVFALTVVKVTRGDPMKGFDHVVEPALLPDPAKTP
jgi:hypothetical protein